MEKASHFYVYGRSAKYLTSVLIMKALVGAFNQEKAIHSRGLLRDYEPSCVPSFEALLHCRNNASTVTNYSEPEAWLFIAWPFYKPDVYTNSDQQLWSAFKTFRAWVSARFRHRKSI